MSWNYRIVRHRDPIPKFMLKDKNVKEKLCPNGYIEWFAIHEAYYNQKGKLNGITNEPIKVISERFNKKEFRWVLKMMKKAIDKPVIDFNTVKEVKNETIKSCNRINKKHSEEASIYRKR